MQRNNRFSSLTFDDFKSMALDDSLSQYEKIGFPNLYRQDIEKFIFEDIKTKSYTLHNLSKGLILDIGSGCSSLPNYFAEYCHHRNSNMIVIDSEEMLSRLKISSNNVIKMPGQFPNIPELLTEYQEKVDFILCYSVIQYTFTEGNIWKFLDEGLSLLKPGGTFFIGDVPNESKRKRFFSSQSGITFHQQFTNSLTIPDVEFNCLEKGYIDDSIVFSILQRCRLQGFDAYVVPQSNKLPMSNRREDIIITRP